MTTTITDLDDFKALDPFFRIIEKGLEGIADGGHFFDLLAEDVIFDYIITTPGYPRRVEGREAVAELYRPYGTMIVLDRCHDLAVHHDIKTGVVVLSTPPKAESFRPGPRTPTGTSRYSRSPIVRSLTGATTSTPWRSSTRSDGRHVECLIKGIAKAAKILGSGQLVGATLTKARAAALCGMHPNKCDQKKYCLDRFIDALVEAGVAERPAPKKVRSSPLDRLRSEYVAYLRDQRGLTEATIYRDFAPLANNSRFDSRM
jgi:uncharacterized protein